MVIPPTNSQKNPLMHQRSRLLMSLVFLLMLLIPTCYGRIGTVSELVSNLFSSLVVHHPNGNFTKLSRNKDLEQDPYLTSWSSQFRTETVFTITVEIPCSPYTSNLVLSYLENWSSQMVCGYQSKPWCMRVCHGIDQAN
jgi:hypothetical protein